MVANNPTVTVTILDREYKISCQDSEKALLRESAQLVETHMRKIKDTGRVVGLDRLAVMTSLNLARELLDIKNKQEHQETIVANSISKLKQKLDEVTNPELK